MHELTDELKQQYQNCNQEELNACFFQECKKGDLENVRYLLISPDLKEHANICADNDRGFRGACRDGHLAIVQYLLTSSELKEHANIHAHNDLGFIWACKYGFLEVVQYLLSFNAAQCIDFQKTEYNLDWAMENKYDDIIIAMMKNLKNNDFMQYIECLSKVKTYNIALYEHVRNIKCGNEVNPPSETALLL